MWIGILLSQVASIQAADFDAVTVFANGSDGYNVYRTAPPASLYISWG